MGLSNTMHACTWCSSAVKSRTLVVHASSTMQTSAANSRSFVHNQRAVVATTMPRQFR
jgi:hypothetical protein